MSSRGAYGAPFPKHKSQNVNSVYSGKNTAASRASGPNKHGGLQALGRTTTIVRRMPKPATLPSLKAEHGQDTNVCLVPQGGQGWSKSSTEQPNADSKSSADANAQAAAANGPDLRPNWAKQTAPANTPPASSAGGSTPGGGAGPDGLQQAQPQTGEYPTLAASMKLGPADMSSQKGGGFAMEEAESTVPLPHVHTPQPAGYIGASGPRVSDRKLPSRYYGGPECGQRPSSQKYDFMQKMAKLSLDSKDSQPPPQPSNANLKMADPTTGNNEIQPGKKQQDGRRGEYGDRQRLSSESTTDSVHHKRSFEQGHEGFPEEMQSGGAAAAYPLQRPPHHHSHATAIVSQKHADGSLSAGQQSGRGDTGFASQSSDIQQHQNPPSSRHYGDRSSVGRDGYDGAGGGGGGGMSGGVPSGYHYVTPPPSVHHNFHGSQHPANKRFDDMAGYEETGADEQQLYRGSVPPQQGGGYPQMPLHGGDGATNWSDELDGKAMQRPTRQPLLSSQPPSLQQQQHYRVDSRHTNSDSDGSGWNASIGNFHVPPNSRRGATNGAYAHQSTGWYGGGNNTNNYPPSLMSLETGVMDVYDNAAGGARYNRQQHGNYYGGASVPRNGPATGGFTSPADEQFSRSDVSDLGSGNVPHANASKMKSGGNRRVVGAELSSASENDSHNYLVNDFFGPEHGEFDNEKALWDRYGGSMQQQQPERGASEQSYNKKPADQPPIRMLKRNDEKSAEYFAYYSTANVLANPEAANDSSSLVNAGINDNEGLGAYQAQGTKKPLLSHKPKMPENPDPFDGAQPSNAGYREFHRRESQTSIHKKNATDPNQNFGSGATIHPNQPTQQHQQGTQQQQKFNRAPGGGKSLQAQPAHQPRSGANNNKAADAVPPATSTKTTGEPNNNSAPAPPENVWEKRKEERLMAERKGLTARQRRQLDQHFPPMSEATKMETTTNEAPNSSFIRDIPRNQDVRLDQKNFGVNNRNSYPQWNPPALGAESHWDELTMSGSNNKPNINGAERRGNRRGNNNDPRQQRGLATDLELAAPPLQGSIGYGGRREFVNSKNRMGSANAAPRGARTSKVRGGTSLSSAGNARSAAERPPKQNGENSAVTQKESDGSNQLLKPSNDMEQDNFSNMGEFHAEDYKIESNDKSKGGQKSKGASKTKTDKDGRTRRSATSGKRNGGVGESQVRRRGNGQPTEDEPSSNPLNAGAPPSNDTSSGTADGKGTENGQPNRQGPQRGGQRSANAKRTGNSRSATSNQVRGTRSSQRQPTSGRSNADGASRQKERLPDVDPGDAGNDAKVQHFSDRSPQVKSPQISDAGPDEWETASESSRADDGGQSKNGANQRNSADRDVVRKTNGVLANGNRATGAGHRRANPTNGDFFDGNSPETQSQQPQKNIGQKNVKPASHTFQSNADSANNNRNSKSSNLNAKNNKRHADGSSLNSHDKIARDGRKGAPSFPVRDGLAGVDINDASVVVIDNHPDLYSGAVSSESVAGDFEEVLSKKAKRQRLQQMEEDRRRQEREKERQEKLLAKRTKQLQRRAERTAAKKANDGKKEASSNDRITVFTNQNYLGIGVDVFGQTGDSIEKDNVKCNDNGVKTDMSEGNKDMVSSGDTFLTQTVQQKPPLAGNLGNISTGLDEIAMTTVWNSTLAAVSSVTSSTTTSSNIGDASSLVSSAAFTTVTTAIPSPIARPVPKNSRPPTSSTMNTWLMGGVAANNKTLETAKEKLDFTFDASIKGSLKGSSVDGLDSADQPLQAKSRYDHLRRSCSPGRGPSAMSSSVSGATGSPVNGISVIGGIKSKSMAVENSDHAQLQKKLDRVKDFWPGSSVVSNGLSNDSSLATDASSQRLNMRGVKSRPHHGIDDHLASTTRTDTTGPSNSYSTVSGIGNTDTTRTQHSLGANNSVSVNRSSNIPFTEFNSNGYISATPGSPSAAFGMPGPMGIQNASHINALPPYQIMFRNGDFLTQSMISAHSANSPPTQHIIGQPNSGIIGTQRSSRPNSFVEHTLIMAQQPNGVPPATPWSTGGGFEFLNGINATPPPPISAPTPGSCIGRSSIPPTAPINAAVGQHYASQMAMVAPQSKIPTARVGSVSYAGYNNGANGGEAAMVSAAGAMINFQSHHVAPPLPNPHQHQMTPHHPVSMPPPPPGNMFGASSLPSHNGKGGVVNAVPSMSVPPPPLGSAHMPPPHFPPPLPFLPPPHPPQHPPAADWPKQHLIGGTAAAMQHKQFPAPFLPAKDGRPEHFIDQYRAASAFGARVPLDFSAPPPPLNGTPFGHNVGGYRAHITGGDMTHRGGNDKPSSGVKNAAPTSEAKSAGQTSNNNNHIAADTKTVSSTGQSKAVELDAKPHNNNKDANHGVTGGQTTAVCAHD